MRIVYKAIRNANIVGANACVHNVVAKSEFNNRSQTSPKTARDIAKTMSYVEKITSDVIQIISDLFLPFCNILKHTSLTGKLRVVLRFDIQCV